MLEALGISMDQVLLVVRDLLVAFVLVGVLLTCIKG